MHDGDGDDNFRNMWSRIDTLDDDGGEELGRSSLIILTLFAQKNIFRRKKNISNENLKYPYICQSGVKVSN